MMLATVARIWTCWLFSVDASTYIVNQMDHCILRSNVTLQAGGSVHMLVTLSYHTGFISHRKQWLYICIHSATPSSHESFSQQSISFFIMGRQRIICHTVHYLDDVCSRQTRGHLELATTARTHIRDVMLTSVPHHITPLQSPAL